MTGNLAAAFQLPAAASRYRDCAEITRLVKPLEPLYLFCPGQLQVRAGEFLAGFPGTVSYAVKANPETRVLKTLHAAGIGHFDVASLAEVALVAETCPGAVLHFNNPIKSEEAIRAAYLRYGVRSFALDEAGELEKISRCTGAARDVTYSVRFKLGHAGAAYDFGSKFGCDENGAAALLRNIRGRGARAALTFHPGSQCTDPAMYGRYVAAAAAIARSAGVTLAELNVGGGYALPYGDAPTPPLQDYFAQVGEAAGSAFASVPPLLCEPGRALVAPCTSLLTRVVHVREDGLTLFLNDGVYGGMQEQSIVDLALPARVWRNGRALRGAAVDYRVFGPTCDPVDRLSRPLPLPAGIRCGDYIEFGLLGAYGSATTTRFNGFGSSHYVDVEYGWNHH